MKEVDSALTNVLYPTNMGAMERTDAVISIISRIRDKSNRFIVDELNRRGIRGLSPSHGGILVTLYKSGESLRMNELAERIGREKSTVTVLIRKLENYGYVKREKDPRDSRNILIALSDKGRDIESAFMEISQELLERVYRGFGEDEKNMLLDKLMMIQGNI